MIFNLDLSFTCATDEDSTTGGGGGFGSLRAWCHQRGATPQQPTRTIPVASSTPEVRQQ